VTNSDQTPQYTPPEVVDYGDLAELTAGASDGSLTDADFPRFTPKGDLTFSY
jgi:hypothetical protein